MKDTIVTVLSWLGLVIAVPLGAVGAVAGFCGAAFACDVPWIITSAGLLGCVLVTAGLSWFAGKRIVPGARGRLALGFGAVPALLLALAAHFTIFRPFVATSGLRSPSIPSGVRFWDLPTGSRIAYLRIPAPEKTHPEPIVFLHGGPGAGIVSASIVTDTMSQFAQDGYDVYLYDQVGGGLSGRLDSVRDYSLLRHVRDLESISIRQQVDADRMIMIGESWGGVLAAHYIAHHPDRVSRCVMVSPGALNNAEWKGIHTGDPIDRLPDEKKCIFQSRIQAHLPRFLLVELLSDINPEAGRGFVPDREADAFITDSLAVLLDAFACDPKRMPEDATVSFGLWAYLMMEKDLLAQKYDVRALLAPVTVPVLILKGECDYIRWDVTYQYKTVSANSTLLWIKGAGHMIYADHPDLFLDSVRAFLGDTPLPLPAYTDRNPPSRL